MQKQQIHAIVAKNLKKIMGRNGITYPELARRCQVSVGMISKIANGQTGITISMAINLSKGLNINLAELLDGLNFEATGSKGKENSEKDNTYLSIGILSINNRRVCCIKDAANQIIGRSELEGGLDLVETSSSLLSLIQESIFEAFPSSKIDSNIFKRTRLNLVTQSYEFEETRQKFEYFATRHFKEVIIIPDWQITFLSAFDGGEGIALIIDKGVSLSYKHDGILRKIGGWKFPVYDLGGENWLGLETIRHTVKAAEGYVPMSNLARNVLSKFNGKIERITETCFKSRDPDVYCLFCGFLLRCYATREPVAVEIITKGFEAIKSSIDLVDKTIGKKHPITLNGSLADIYMPFLDKSRLVSPTDSMHKAKLLAGITDEFLANHGVTLKSLSFSAQGD